MFTPSMLTFMNCACRSGRASSSWLKGFESGTADTAALTANRLPFINVCKLCARLKYYMSSFCLDPGGAHRGRDGTPQSHHAHSCATSKARHPRSQSGPSPDSEHGTVTLHLRILWSVYFYGFKQVFSKFLSDFRIIIPSNPSFFLSSCLNY